MFVFVCVLFFLAVGFVFVPLFFFRGGGGGGGERRRLISPCCEQT